MYIQPFMKNCLSYVFHITFSLKFQANLCYIDHCHNIMLCKLHSSEPYFELYYSLTPYILYSMAWHMHDVCALNIPINTSAALFIVVSTCTYKQTLHALIYRPSKDSSYLYLEYVVSYVN